MNPIKRLINNIKNPWRSIPQHKVPYWARMNFARRPSPLYSGVTRQVAKGKHNLYMVKFTAHQSGGYRKYFYKPRMRTLKRK